MDTLDIPLQKRQYKAVLLILAFLFVSLMLVVSVPMMLKPGWEGKGVFAVMLILVIVFGLRLRQFFYKEVRLVVYSDGSRITFHNVNEAGKIFNEEKIEDTAKLTRFYVVRTRTRYLMYNYSYAFDGQGWLSGATVDPFPSLYEATEQDRSRVLAYVKTLHPNIELGYESAWSKLTKK